ncbi:major facilitator superfamily domain-containing protein [Crucibulum laeve]|uniref:Major facilitator superfamily domain-containing protein n=1 Tax=Crucibulum laeve TaxID=68775 RepID=A0A5C3MIP9_9AGAR|nr:major facilitator superfamily domain-containing protein [Crucibulum laeve]
MEKASSKGSRSSLEKRVDTSSEHTGSSEHDSALDKKVWWKIDLYVLPVITMFYLLSWLDRTNLGNARVAGLQRDLKMTNTQYSIALTVTFIPYILSEIPSNLLLKIVGPNLLLPVLLTGWGIVTTLQGVVHSYAGLLVCRFFIGLLEGGVLPGIVLYLSFFYPRRKMQTRISAFFSSASLSGAFSGLLATGIMKMHGIGNRPAWAWIFILEGLFTVVFGILTFFLLPRSPAHAYFLNQQEKDYVVGQLRADGAIGADDKADSFSWAEVRQTFRLPQVWLLGFVYFFNGTIVYSLGYFTPSIVQGLGYTPIRTQLMTVGPYAAAFFLTNVTSYIGDKYRCRGVIIVFCSICCITGFAMFLGSHHKATLYGSLFMTIGGINCSSPPLAAWVANNTAPHVRRATALAFLSMITNSGGILSTWLLGSLSPAPRYTMATRVLLSFSILMGLFAVLTLAYLHDQNKKKKVIRETTTKTEEAEGLGDRSAWYEYIL